ncbi:hypothetical protein AN958_02277 [Leucoagaricus sp. SymC.cos]|nr:hypothetical protein AN958_02277 [Leucoagaricus sp. SymC.cos]
MVGSDCSLPVFQRCCRVQVRSRKERRSGPKPPWLIVGNVYNGKSIFDVTRKSLSLVDSAHCHSCCVLQGCGGMHIFEADCGFPLEDPDGKGLTVACLSRKQEVQLIMSGFSEDGSGWS